MSSRDDSDHLTQIVEQAIEEHGFAQFAEYWELYKRTAGVQSVRGFYFRTERKWRPTGGYCNVAIIGDGLLIDIDGDDSDRDRSGGLIVKPLDSIAKVLIYARRLPGIPATLDATLVVIAGGADESDVGFHWVAKTEDEEDRLVEFARSLVQAISSR